MTLCLPAIAPEQPEELDEDVNPENVARSIDALLQRIEATEKLHLEALLPGSLYFLGGIQHAPNARTVTITCRVHPTREDELRLIPLHPIKTQGLRVRLLGPWTAVWVEHLCMQINTAIQFSHPSLEVSVDLRGENWEPTNLLQRLVPLLRWFRADERLPGGFKGEIPSDRY